MGTFGSLSLFIPGFIFIDYVFFFVATMLFIGAVTITVLPFSPQEQVDRMGLKKSIHICRLCGIFLIIFGLSSILLHFVLMN